MQTTPLITDIVELICEHADPGSLCVMARTARLLHEPAIQILWEKLPCLVPLLQCFPADSWTIQGDMFFKFTRILTPKDWTSVLKYGSLVRSFAVDKQSAPVTSYRHRPHTTVWETVCCVRPAAVLFPSLRSVCWRDLQLPDRCLPSFLICTGEESLACLNLEGFDLAQWGAVDTLKGSLSIIAARFPDLRELNVGGCSQAGTDAQGELRSTLVTLTRSFTSMVSFSSLDIPVSPAAIRELIRLKMLKRLAIRLPDDAAWPFGYAEPHPETPLSSRLKKLVLLSTAQSYIAFSKAVTLPYATSLTLQLTDRLPAHLVAELFSRIRSQCSRVALQQLMINPFPEQTLSGTGEGLILPTHLRPLLEFRRLSGFVLRSPFRYSLDDAFCADMAKAWPSLKMMALTGNTRVHDLGGAMPLPSVRALPPFAAYCPKLDVLALGFDGSRWVDEGSFEADRSEAEIYGPLVDRASTSAMSTLGVGMSPIAGAEYMAAFLARIFPSLGTIKCEAVPSSADNGRRERWTQARRLLPLFKQIRQDERLRQTRELAAEGTQGWVGYHGLATGTLG